MYPSSSSSSFLVALCFFFYSRTAVQAWTAPTIPKTTSTPITHVQVVLFGVGDLRVDDHVGFSNALQAVQSLQEQEHNSDKARSRYFLFPMFLGHSAMLQHIPGMKAHTYDTCHLVVAALQQLHESLQTWELSLSYVPCDDAKDMEDKSNPILWTSIIQQTVQAALAKDHPDDDDDDDETALHISVHVCDLGPADNAMQYGPYAHLASEVALTDVTILPWKASLRGDGVSMKTSTAIPNDDYPSYQAQCATVPCQTPLDVTHAFGSNWNSNAYPCLSTATATFPITATDLMKQINFIAPITPPPPPPATTTTTTTCCSSRNTGLYATHWGGLPYHTVGCQAALEQVRSYVQDCQQDDALWFASKKRAVAQANPNSLEHAAMLWQLQISADANTTIDNSKNIHSGKPLHWLPGESIIRFLSAPLLLGTVSARRIHSLSLTGTVEQPWASVFKNDLPLQSMVLAREWHVQLAAQHLRQEPSARYWRYHGYLCRYFQTDLTAPAATTTSEQNKSPTEALLWVHGFGASGVQWKGMVEALQKQQQHTAHTAYCPDMLGFGHSEKPALSYTGYLWESQMLEFVKEIVPQDTYIVGGNSIGGYTALSLAASDMASSSRPLSASGAPGTNSCTGLVLFNSAGPVLTNKEVMAAGDKTRLSVAQQTQQQLLSPCSPPPRWVGRAFGNVLLQYLRPRIQSICVNLYPTNPSAVNSILCDSIRRDSLDPGAIYVMMAGAKLPIPRTANELLQADSGASDANSPEATFADRPVLIAQGVLDPLNDAQDRMERFAALRAGVTAVPIQAGHCPHDELPDIVADEVSKWLRATRATRAALYDGTTTRAVESSL